MERVIVEMRNERGDDVLVLHLATPTLREMVMLLNLVVVLGLPIHWQYAMQGIVLVLATALQGFRQFLLSK